MTNRSFDLHASDLRLIAAYDRLTEHLNATVTMDDLEKTLLATHHIERLKEALMLEVLFHDLMLEASTVQQSVRIN